MSVASASTSAARGAGRTIDRLLTQPRAVLGVLVGAQIVGTLALAAAAPHNGWVYYQGGDQIINTTTGWLLGRLELPPTEVGFLWPLIQAPMTWFTGPTFVQALPPLLFLQVLVLAPIALLCIYGIAHEIGGRLLGYWAATLWVIAPFAAIPLFVDRYHEKWVDQFLPQALGLTAAADYASMVAVLAAALFIARSLAPGPPLGRGARRRAVRRGDRDEAVERTAGGRGGAGLRSGSALAGGSRVRRRGPAGSACARLLEVPRAR